jgi:hydroxyethylthiazole kinase-like uncharacterized protein yjeF
MTQNILTGALLKERPLPMPREGSKDERGSALVLGGSASVPGAALLAGVAALRAGAGKLKIATVGSAAAGMGLAVPEAMVIGLPETPDGGVDGARAADCLRTTAKGCDALLVGPGLMESGPTTALAVELLEALPSAAFILDAAAICGLSARAGDVRRHGGRVVITPHAGEMAQLLDRSRDAVEADPLDAARAAADLLQAVVVMKGARTWIVDPQGVRWLYEGGGVGLATSGSGDALAGIIVGLLARGVAPLTAALWGVFLHGEAGKRLAASVGPLGFLARELSGEVPGLLREMAG